jgi:putative transposase
LLLDKILYYFREYHWELHHWVILDNHYHLLGKSHKGTNLASIFKRLHGSTATYIHEATHCEKPVWWNYWDYCPRNEREYYIRQNYLLWNPVKHGYVENLKDYPFSSFHDLYDTIGREKLAEQFIKFPEYRTFVLREAEKDDF